MAALIATAALVVALPQLLSRSVARRILTARAGQILAPGSLDAAAVRVSWFGPTEIDGVVLRDDRGGQLVAADRAIFDWNLWQILFQRPETASLKLPGAEVAIERRDDGVIDLYETLRPIIREHPDHRLLIDIEGGRLRFRDPALAEPIVADRADIRLDIPRDPQPVEWNVVLGRDAADGKEPARAIFKGSVHRPGDGGATVSLEASGWPWALALAGGLARGELDGKMAADRRDARWSVTGHATAKTLISAGARTGDDARRLGAIRAAWDVEGQRGAWTARSLELTMPYARIDGGGRLDVADGIARVDLKGSLSPDWEAIQADLRRDVEPIARIAGRSREWRVSGSLGASGAEDRLSGLVAELGVQLDALDIFGLRLSQTEVVLRADGGRFRFDPIDARLNEGALHLEPEVVRPQDGPVRIKLGAASTLKDAVVNDEVSHRVLSYVAPVLDGATRVRGRVSVGGLDAEFPVGEAPAASARVEGNVLFDEVRFLPGPLAEAIIDLLPSPKEAGADTEGEPMLVLRDPISVRIADRKVYQRGLIVPLGRIGSVGLEGSVDFEKHLDLVARFRVNPPRADRPLLAALLNNARFELPIRGTLEDPRIDQDALKERLKSMGTDMLGNSIVAGADGLFRLLDGLPRRREARKPPADAPDAGPTPESQPAPRPSAEERREAREQRRLERQEKKAQRRMRRDGPPE
jgi:translocation and assembly module TamB